MHRAIYLLFVATTMMLSTEAFLTPTKSDYGYASVLSSTLIKMYNGTAVGDAPKALYRTLTNLSEHNLDHFHLIISNSLFLLTGIVISAHIGTLRSRRNALYYVGAASIAALLSVGQYYFAWLALWGVLHSVAHHLWPFITVAGLNIKASAFPDVFVHLAMHAVVHAALIEFGVSELTRWASLTILAGCCWNCYLASYSRVDAKWFVATSVFQAFSTGSWVGFLLAVSSEHKGGATFETHLWILWIGAALNWVVFKNSTKMLKRLFAISYLDTLFIIPVWLYILNNQ